MSLTASFCTCICPAVHLVFAKWTQGWPSLWCRSQAATLHNDVYVSVHLRNQRDDLQVDWTGLAISSVRRMNNQAMDVCVHL